MTIDLLGGFRVAAGDRQVEEAAWRLRKARTLLKLLALTPDHCLHREQVIEALWPDGDAAAASNNLRQALYVTRRALDSCGDDGAARVELTHEVLTLTRSGLSIDVEQFQAAAAAAQRSPSVESCRTAIELYRGELLPEDRFEAWAALRREGLRELHLAVLLELAGLCTEASDHAGAIAALQQALVDEPSNERAHRELMRTYALTGRRQRALAQFHLLRESLRREFADEPEDETRRQYQDILTRGDVHPDAQGFGVNTDGYAVQAPASRRTGGAITAADNLPLQLTSFVGRNRELEEVVGLARRHRLVTLTGPGGCGKTRLALEAAARLLRDPLDGLWLVELAGLSDGALVSTAVASMLGVESRSSRPSEQAIAAHVGTRNIVIVLDNCEHLVAACAALAEQLLTGCPNLKLVATSREPLHVAGEVNWRVPSLPPDEAARLFVDRASTISSRFKLTGENKPAVQEVCRRVDGIPLAIELAAARAGVLTPAQIAERLSQSLAVLATSSRTALSRQQTLVATLDWSHELLDDDEQILMRRLGTFADRFDLDAVEVVCGGDLDVLARLVDKSLVVVEEHDGVARYRLLDTVRHYARERLVRAGEQPTFQARHRARYLAVAEALEPATDEPDARARVALEADELRLAMRTALREEPFLALRLAAVLWRFWHDRGDRTESARWLEAALRANPEPSRERAAVLHGLSVLALRTNQHERALETAHEAVAFWRDAGEDRALCEELHHLGTLAWVFADFPGAEARCEESQRLAEATGEAPIVASVLHTLGVLEASRGEAAKGRRLIRRSVELLRQLPATGEPLLLPVALGYGQLGAPRLRRRRFLEHTFVTARRVRPPSAVAYALCDEASTARDEGDLVASRLMLEESVSLFGTIGDDLGRSQALSQLGNLVSTFGEHELAAELHAESLALRETANDARGIGLSLLAIAGASGTAGRLEEAWETAGRALALFERADDGPGQAGAVMQLGYVAADSGRPEQARELQERALALWRGFIPMSGWCGTILLELAELDAALGDQQRVPERLTAAMETYAHTGDEAGVAYCEAALRAASNGALTAE